MKPLLIAAAGLTLLAWGAFRLYQDPRVQQLFREPRPRPASGSVPAAGKSSVPPEVRISPKRRAKNSPRPATASSPASPPGEEMAANHAAEPEVVPAAVNTVDNNVVTRVILQILAARDLAYGIALSTSDQVIVVEGVVDSMEKRNQILAVLEKAREARRIDAERLTVIQKRPVPVLIHS